MFLNRINIQRYGWNFDGRKWYLTLQIPKSDYQAYKKVTLSERISHHGDEYSFLVTTKDSTIIQLANKLHEIATREQYSRYGEVSFVLAFVQSLPYYFDHASTGHQEYPRFPVETLVDRGGDCEDTAILFATILLALKYGAIFIFTSDTTDSHLAVGVRGDSLHGRYWTVGAKKYYFCETTAENWRVGQMSDEYERSKIELFTIDQKKQFTFSQVLSP